VAGIVEEVVQAAAMSEQLAHADLVAARDGARQPALDRVVERQPALLHELEHDRGDVRLGDAADPEPRRSGWRASGAQVGDAVGEHAGLITVTHEGDGSRHPGAGQAVQVPTEAGRPGRYSEKSDGGASDQARAG
jgi:hypothetical protein